MSKQGIYIPLITPLDDDGKVCRRSVGQLLAQSQYTASGYIPCLTSGEGWVISREQWRDMVRYTLDAAGGKPLIVGIEQPTTAEVLDYAAEAKQLGASAIMITTPFGDGITQQEILQHYRTVHDETGLQTYIYNESALSKNETHFETLLAIADLPRVAGIKDSHETGRDNEQIKALQQRGLAYYIGWEHHLANGISADGSVVSLANLEPALCRLAVNVKGAGLQAEINRLSETYDLLAEDWYRYVKKALKARGVIATDHVVAAQ